ncbi:hypothetical protein ACTXLD_09090 [Psychrobacter faecalis]
MNVKNLKHMNAELLKEVIEYKFFKQINKRRGWKTDRKIVVIESDDWGSIRMPNREVYEKTIEMGIKVQHSHYCKYDTLASTSDLDALFSVLKKHRDFTGSYAKITANTIMGNPDFEKIKANGYEKYYFEKFIDTMKRYDNRSFKSWQQGMDEEIFIPQLHGREHLNIERWLNKLRNGSKELSFAFDNQYYGLPASVCQEDHLNYQAALDYDSFESKLVGNESISHALNIFEDTFGYKSESFIGPNYYWHDETSKILYENGVKYLQGGYVQRLPDKKIRHNYMGRKNKYNQIHLIRNVVFEPSSLVKKDWLSTSLNEIEKAFRLRKPAIICSHRVNYIGSIFEENRTQNLALLDKLLTNILKKWPNVEFFTSSELGDLITESAEA